MMLQLVRLPTSTPVLSTTWASTSSSTGSADQAERTALAAVELQVEVRVAAAAAVGAGHAAQVPDGERRLTTRSQV